MSEEFERIYNVNLGRAWLAPRQKRTNKAMSILRKFAMKHGRTDEVKISEDINEFLWIKGKRHPPRKIQIKLIKDKEGLVTINKIESKKTIPKEKLSKKEDKLIDKKEDKLIDINPELKEEKTNALPEVEVSKEDKPSDDNPELKEEKTNALPEVEVSKEDKPSDDNPELKKE